MPAALTGFFAVLTVSGSARFLVPVAVVVLLVAWRRFEALLVGLGAHGNARRLGLEGDRRTGPPCVVGSAVVLGFQLPQRTHARHASSPQMPHMEGLAEDGCSDHRHGQSQPPGDRFEP